MGLVGEVFAVAVDDPTSHDATAVASEAARTLDVPADAYGTVAQAIDAAKDAAGRDGGVVVAGSLYLVGEARSGMETSDERMAEAHLRFSAEVTLDDEHEAPEPVNLPDE
jgi:folylpolyglutamate synthase/dihydropteroate synthase